MANFTLENQLKSAPIQSYTMVLVTVGYFAYIFFMYNTPYFLFCPVAALAFS
jgi:hypothetical protein